MKDLSTNNIEIVTSIRIYLFLSHYSKHIALLVINIFLILTFSIDPRGISTNSHYIFTFWEPHDSLPGYIKLCIKTWRKYLPTEYKIIILDYSNIRDYLGYKLVKQILCKDMTLQIQADAIRVAILQKYGGFWMDADTLIINHECMTMFNGSDLIMFGIKKQNIQHIGFIYALKNSTILKAWLNSIIRKVRIYKYILFLKNIFPTKYFIQSFNKIRIWSYLGNGILDDMVKYASEKDFKHIERDDVYVVPDQIFLKGPIDKRYRDFYFTSIYNISLLDMCKGILLLHNSWTPMKYKKMSEEVFLKQDILLSHILSKLLIDKT